MDKEDKNVKTFKNLAVGVGGNTLFFLYVISPLWGIQASIWSVLLIVLWFEIFNTLVLQRFKVQ